VEPRSPGDTEEQEGAASRHKSLEAAAEHRSLRVDELCDELVVNQVSAVARDALVRRRDGSLAGHPQVARAAFVCHAGALDALEQAMSQRAMDLDGRADELFRESRLSDPMSVLLSISVPPRSPAQGQRRTRCMGTCVCTPRSRLRAVSLDGGISAVGTRRSSG